MSISPRKKQQLATFLGGLQGATALKLFAAIEADRAAGGKGLPHDALLDSLRKQMLARGQRPPARKPDAKRLFFTPFEDFFIGAHGSSNRRIEIARPSLGPIWRLMMTDRALADAALAAAALDDALRGKGDPASLERALFFAAEAGLGRLCAVAEDNREAASRLADALGGEGAFGDLKTLNRLLRGVEILKALHRLVPSGAPSLSETQLYELRALFLSAYGKSRRLGADLLLALKGRLEKPWRALAVYYHLDRSSDERLVAAGEQIALLKDSLIDDLEALARALERDGAGALEADTARLRIRYFADFADGLSKEAAKAGDTVFLKRIDACRDVAAEAFERFGELALAVLREATPTRQAGGSTRLMAQRPDIARPLTPAAVENACDAAGLIAESAGLAERLGAEAAFAADIARDAADRLTAYAKDLVVEIRAAEGEERRAARRLLEHVLVMAAYLVESEEIETIRDRAATASLTV